MLIEFMRPNGFIPVVESEMRFFTLLIFNRITKIPIRPIFYQKMSLKKNLIRKDFL
jgi:hypothetical protein